VELRIGAWTGPKLGLSPPILTSPGSAIGGGFGRIVIFGWCDACSSQRPARRYWFSPFATVLPSILFHMIWTTTGVASVAMATVKAKRQRLSMVISYLQQASFYVGNYT
jgi:hypothetical protein